jgi:hypothetical protein
MNRQDYARFVLGLMVVFSMACGDVEEDVEPEFGGEIAMNGNLGESVEQPLNLENNLSGERDFEFDVVPEWLTVDPMSGTLAANSSTQATLAAECGDEASSIEDDLVYYALKDGVRYLGVILTIVLNCRLETNNPEVGE